MHGKHAAGECIALRRACRAGAWQEEGGGSQPNPLLHASPSACPATILVCVPRARAAYKVALGVGGSL